MAAMNPYAAPKTRVADHPNPVEAPPLWNPDAVASWSLLFSPAFGAWLHMRNWEALGQPDRALQSRRWMETAFGLLIVNLVLTLFFVESGAVDAVSRVMGLAILITWYIVAARGQARYVKERFGNTYPRKRWGKPLLVAFGLLFGYKVLVMAVVFLAVALT